MERSARRDAGKAEFEDIRMFPSGEGLAQSLEPSGNVCKHRLEAHEITRSASWRNALQLSLSWRSLGHVRHQCITRHSAPLCMSRVTNDLRLLRRRRISSTELLVKGMIWFDRRCLSGCTKGLGFPETWSLAHPD